MSVKYSVNIHHGDSQNSIVFRCSPANYPFWKGSEGAARIAKMMEDLLNSATEGPYAEMAREMRVSVEIESTMVNRSNGTYCPRHAVLLHDTDQDRCYLCDEEDHFATKTEA